MNNIAYFSGYHDVMEAITEDPAAILMEDPGAI
jgi:hypothetical protein